MDNRQEALTTLVRWDVNLFYLNVALVGIERCDPAKAATLTNAVVAVAQIWLPIIKVYCGIAVKPLMNPSTKTF